MIRRTSITKIILICSLLFYNCNYCSMNLYSNISDVNKLKSCNSYFSPSKNDVYDVDESQLIAEIPSANIKLYFVEKDEDDGVYRGFVLQRNENKRFFIWENETNPAYAPELILSDLDKDRNNEIIIILTKGHGTSLRDQEVHVIKQEPFLYEVLVENPNIILHKNVQIKELAEDFEILLNNKKILYSKNEVLYPAQEGGIGWWYDNIRFEVKDNTIYARIPVYAPVTKFLGELVIKYKYADKIFQKESVEYIDSGIFKVKIIECIIHTN